MIISHLVRVVCAGTVLLALSITQATGADDTAPPKRPNFVFILVDDLGYMDIGANNPDTFYQTPNVDGLAASGMRFTDGYAANPVCSPTRYSIMTGKYPSRVDATNFFSGSRGGRFLPAPLHSDMPREEVTIAEALRQHGYQTAFLGKWHLGPSEEFWPRAQGFDVNIAGHSAGAPFAGGYFSPYKMPTIEDGPVGEHLTARLATEACGLIERFSRTDDPFLVYLSFYTVHTPLQAPKDLVEKYQKKAAALADAGSPEFGEEEQVWPDKGGTRSVRIRQCHATYAAMVESMDTAVGRVLAKLEELGLHEDTVVMFTADNGGLSTAEGSPTSNLPLRGGKGWLYEGGIREPYLIRWPGVTKPGSISSEPVVSTDFYPTILDIAGLPARPQQHLDGKSLAPLLSGNARQIDRDAIYWHYPHYSNQGGIPGGAIRQGRYKLLERFEDGRVHLYDLQDDIAETNDLASEMPEKVDELRTKLHRWYKEVDAKFLQPKTGSGEMPWRPAD